MKSWIDISYTTFVILELLLFYILAKMFDLKNHHTDQLGVVENHNEGAQEYMMLYISSFSTQEAEAS